MLNVIDEFSRKCLAMMPFRWFRSFDAIDVLDDLFIEHHQSTSDLNNWPEFIALSPSVNDAGG
ncbi:hypothetical protein AiwAL_16975 [Acidiphilium sp. AL]|uniref:Transposase n=1 Tax=Acidiphilium iwatense TaxID=768198 RepID=A0ABS9E407_9PROT|nr:MULTISPECIES: hypothetical protein [Acidiphilium]MCF3948641.1 hypothetical protein [Acidiphilium iwatense]MCU4161774.1 hypothetical protein [Acidiphilium sp. AL]